MMMFFIERQECDDDYDRQIRIWWWWCCCWSKGQSVDHDIADRKVKVLKMLLIERSKMLKMLLLIEQSKCWRCCWSKGPSAEDVVANWKIKMIKMLLIKAVKELMMKTEDWRWRLHDVEKLPMIYRCVTLLMLVMSPISTLDVVDVVVEYPSR